MSPIVYHQPITDIGWGFERREGVGNMGREAKRNKNLYFSEENFCIKGSKI